MVIRNPLRLQDFIMAMLSLLFPEYPYDIVHPIDKALKILYQKTHPKSDKSRLHQFIAKWISPRTIRDVVLALSCQQQLLGIANLGARHATYDITIYH